MKFFNPLIRLFHDILISKLTRTESCTKLPFTLCCYLNVGSLNIWTALSETMILLAQEIKRISDLILTLHNIMVSPRLEEAEQRLQPN